MNHPELSAISVDAATRVEVINALIAKLHAQYVFPEVAQQIEAELRQQLIADAFAGVTTAQALCDMLTQTLQAVSHDKHLNLGYNLDAGQQQDSADNSGNADKTDNAAEDPRWRESYRQSARLRNYGFARVERLPGNIGYLDLRGFEEPAIAAEAGIAAMTLLAHTSALIVDLRKNGGGYPEMVALLTTYLFDDEMVHLNSLYWRENNSTQQFWTLPYVPGSRFGGKKPVYVLTSNRTFSGAEEFTYNLKQRKRATIIGETTGGGANPGDVFLLPAHFTVFIPTGRAINPISQDNWEGKGIEPDIAVPQEEALQVALVAALKAVSAELDATLGAETTATPATIPLERLRKEVQEALAAQEASQGQGTLADDTSR